MSLAKRIKEWRRQAGLTQAELADLLGVDKGTVYRWERGTMRPAVHMEYAILYVLREHTK